MSSARKRAPTPTPRRKPRPSSLLPKDRTPAERLAQLERQAAAQGIKPLDEATLDAMGNVWPEDESIDDFLAWLRQSRREGK